MSYPDYANVTGQEFMASSQKSGTDKSDRKARSTLKTSIRDRIIAVLTESSPKLLKTNELSKKLGIAAESPEHDLVREVLEELQEQNVVFRGPRRRFGRVVPDVAIEGTIRMIDSGRWELIPEGGTRPVLRFDRDEIWTAFDGDIVRARPLSVARPGEIEIEIPWGEVTRVVERRTDRIVGTLRQGRELYLQPDSRKMHRTITIPRRHAGDARIGDKVVVELLDWKDPEDDPSGKVVRRIGKAGEMNAEIASLMEEFDVRVDFPEEVIAEAESFSSRFTRRDLAGRRDLRDDPIFTIDPYDARDFDDAISIQRHDNGDMTLGVHIADVGHYVREGSALDKEAFRRGTSIYLVTGVIPMLPERLSNDLCSLRPDEDRLAYSVHVRFSPKGAIRDYEIFKSVIRSKRRFTYEEALEVLETGEGDFAEDLLAINKIAHILRRNRRKKGSIDFETTELKFRLDEEGKPSEVIAKRPTESTRLIEDCMLLANRIVAEHIGRFKYLDRRRKGGDRNPFIYRIHDMPPKDKLIDLSQFVRQFGYSIPVDNIRPKDLQNLLEKAKEQGNLHLITEVALRSMAKAVYSEYNVGHFGLAFDWYTHFTSPIRRYPDLIVHRLLHEYQAGMDGNRTAEHAERVGWIADHSSQRERVAVEAERRSVKIAEVEYLSDHVGDVYEATIISILPFGMFAELKDLGIEGMIPTRTIDGEAYRFDERKKELVGRRSNKRYRIGDNVFVRVVKVDEINQQIDLGLIDGKEYERSMREDAEPWQGEPERKRESGRREGRRKSGSAQRKGGGGSGSGRQGGSGSGGQRRSTKGSGRGKKRK